MWFLSPGLLGPDHARELRAVPGQYIAIKNLVKNDSNYFDAFTLRLTNILEPMTVLLFLARGKG